MTDEIRQLREEVARLSAELTRLSEIEAVRRCKYQYWRCFDTANIDGMREVLHPDVELSVVAGVYSMKYEGREGYLEMVRTGAHADMISHHNGHHPEIDIVGPEEAIGTWYLYDDLYEYRRNFRLYGTAFYRDRYVKHEGRWKIRYSQFHRLYEIADPLPPRENITAHYLATHGYKHPGADPLPPFPKVKEYDHEPGVMPPFLDAT
jgi:hypothetical protein